MHTQAQWFSRSGRDLIPMLPPSRDILVLTFISLAKSWHGPCSGCCFPRYLHLTLHTQTPTSQRPLPGCTLLSSNPKVTHVPSAVPQSQSQAVCHTHTPALPWLGTYRPSRLAPWKTRKCSKLEQQGLLYGHYIFSYWLFSFSLRHLSREYMAHGANQA